MSTTTSPSAAPGTGPAAAAPAGTRRPVFRIIVHVSPPADHGVTHWTEAPECPAAAETGRSADQAVEATRAIIRTWWMRETGQSTDQLEFVVLHGSGALEAGADG